MRHARLLALFCVGIFLAAAVPQDPGRNPPPNAEQPEVLTRGPVHEAYASAASGEVKASPIIAKQPPEPIEELPPDQKPEGENVQWVPGYWAWDDERSDFIWISGFWRVPPPGSQWVAGGWHEVAGGWQWSPGFWHAAKAEQVEYVPPPPPRPEIAVPPAPDESSTYVPGTWVYADTRHVWRAGYWAPFRPGWVIVPAHYVWTPIGCVFVDTYYDLPLERADAFSHRFTSARWFTDVRTSCTGRRASSTTRPSTRRCSFDLGFQLTTSATTSTSATETWDTRAGSTSVSAGAVTRCGATTAITTAGTTPCGSTTSTRCTRAVTVATSPGRRARWCSRIRSSTTSTIRPSSTTRTSTRGSS